MALKARRDVKHHSFPLTFLHLSKQHRYDPGCEDGGSHLSVSLPQLGRSGSARTLSLVLFPPEILENIFQKTLYCLF